MDIIEQKLNELLKTILENSNNFKNEVNLLKNKQKIIDEIDQIIFLYKKEKNEK